MKILITGTPATGKTSIAKELSKLMGIEYFDVKEIIKANPNVIDSIEDNELVINSKLKKVLEKSLPKSYIIESHLIEYMPKTDAIVILRTRLETLKKRLEERKYSKQKVMDNLETEMLDYFTQSTKMKKVIEFDTSKGSIKSNAKKIMEKIIAKKYNKGELYHSESEIKKILV